MILLVKSVRKNTFVNKHLDKSAQALQELGDPNLKLFDDSEIFVTFLMYSFVCLNYFISLLLNSNFIYLQFFFTFCMI